jgi:septal ring factor EnvC (AmiA/AmiB activator)
MVTAALGGGFRPDELFEEVRTAYGFRTLDRLALRQSMHHGGKCDRVLHGQARIQGRITVLKHHLSLTAVILQGQRLAAHGLPIEDQLAKARADLAALQRDHQAQADLLTEESAAVTSLRVEVKTLRTQLETLTHERDAASGQVTGLQSRITDLEASQADFDRRVQTEVARIAASTGTSLPARVTPAGDGQSPSAPAGYDQLAAEYDRLVSERKPEEAAAFFDRHLKPFFQR